VGKKEKIMPNTLEKKGKKKKTWDYQIKKG